MENIKEDTLIDKETEKIIDDFVEKGNITGLAHHYHKGNDDVKNLIIQKSKLAKGEVFVNRIKNDAKKLLENRIDEMVNNVLGETTDDVVDDKVEETTTTGSVGGQYTSKFFLKGKMKEGEEMQEDIQLNNPEDYNKIPKKILNLANEVDNLIKRCVDSDGDPVGVVDTSGTWQSEDIYSIEIKNNFLTIKSKDVYGKEDYPSVYDFNVDLEEIFTVEDCIDELKYIKKLYVKTCKKLENTPVQNNEPMDENIVEKNDDVVTSDDIFPYWDKVMKKYGDCVETEALDEIMSQHFNVEDPSQPLSEEAVSAMFEALSPLLGDEILEDVSGDIKYSAEDIEDYSDLDLLYKTFGEENLNLKHEDEDSFEVILNDKFTIKMKLNGDEDPTIEVIDNEDSQYEFFDSIEDVIKSLQEFGQEEPAINELNEAKIPNPSDSHLKTIHNENKKNTKAHNEELKKEMMKSTDPESKNQIPIDRDIQKEELDGIKKGMEDLEYDIENEETKERHKEQIDPPLESEAVTDQFGHKTPKMDKANVVPSEVGKNINKKVEDNKKEEKTPQYAKDPQPVKIVKEEVDKSNEIYKEGEDYVITYAEKQKIDEEVMAMKKLLGYNPSDNVKTKQNKKDADVLNKIRNIISENEKK